MTTDKKGYHGQGRFPVVGENCRAGRHEECLWGTLGVQWIRMCGCTCHDKVTMKEMPVVPPVSQAIQKTDL